MATSTVFIWMVAENGQNVNILMKLYAGVGELLLQL
jgi:hypothetical protein